MLANLRRQLRLTLGLIWTSTFMLVLARVLYGEVSLRQQAPQLLRNCGFDERAVGAVAASDSDLASLPHSPQASRNAARVRPN